VARCRLIAAWGTLGCLWLVAHHPVAAQGRPRAEVTPAVEAAVSAGSPVRLALRVVLPEGLHVQSDQPRDPSLIPTVLSIEPPTGISVQSLTYPSPTDFTLEGQTEPLAVFGHDFVVGARILVASGVADGEVVIPGRLRYQACDDRVCFAPATAEVRWSVRVGSAGAAAGTASEGDVFTRLSEGREVSADGATGTAPPVNAAPAFAGAGGFEALARFSVAGTTGGYLGRDDFLEFVGDAESGTVSAGWFAGRGPLAILALVLLGGLALNLTPCVLPMIPINLAIIGAGAQAGSRRRGFLLGATYGGAMAVVYGVLGLIVVLTAGTFGTLNASPWFNVAMALVFVVLALGMFDVVPIDFSRWSSGRLSTSGRGTFALAFTMGGVAALLAGACVAPVVIQVVIFASDLYARGTTVALALPFVLGLGMALPWPVAGAGVAALPKPGPWMVRVKQVMGVVILVTAGYYGQLASGLFDARAVDPGAVADSVQSKLAAGWTDSLDAGLAQAEREGKPVLLDFWATWCKNCLTMDATTFEDPAVTTALADYVKIKVQAEDPDAEPAKGLLSKYNAVGLPTYVILHAPATSPRVGAASPSVPGVQP
jgi:thiol:disulfide interchange protein DsbD